MENQGYEYRGMIAEYWDLLRGDTSQWVSRPYFLRVIRESGEPALDVACGTGRLLLDYLREGIDIDGVDISPEMVAICREKARKSGLRPRLYVQSMEALDLPLRYQTIIVPSSSFLQITGREDALRALKRFREHLLPGGVLCFSSRVVVPEPQDEEFRVIAEARRESDGALVRRWWRCTYDLAKRLQHTEDRYEVLVDGRVVAEERHARSPALTWYLASEALGLVAQAGFARVRAESNFTSAPATDEDTSYTVLGMRPAA